MRAMDRRTSHAALAQLEAGETPARGGVSIGRFAGLDADGRFQVEVSGAPAVSAISTVALTDADAGAAVVVAFDRHDPDQPIILGRALTGATDERVSVKSDGRRLVISAEQEIELRCGGASLVLTRAGKVLIRGNYVLTRSRGGNKIKGAYVDIN